MYYYNNPITHDLQSNMENDLKRFFGLVSIYQVPVSVDGSLHTSLNTGLIDEFFAHLLGIKGEVANFPIYRFKKVPQAN